MHHDTQLATRPWGASTTGTVRMALTFATMLLIAFAAWSAAAPEARANPVDVNTRLEGGASGYTGWTYVGNDQNVTAYKWTDQGYVAATLTPGTPVHATPFQDGWHWAYRNGHWYAVESRMLRVWGCTGQPVHRRFTEPTRVYAQNTRRSQLIGVIPAGYVAWDSCSTTKFTDAYEAIGATYCAALGCGPDKYSLVYTYAAPACASSTPACTYDQSHVKVVSGYVLNPRASMTLTPTP